MASPVFKTKIKEIIKEHNDLSPQILNIEHTLSDFELLKLQEELELQNAWLRLDHNKEVKNVQSKNSKHSKKINDETLNHSEKLCRKFIKDPYHFFADAKNPILRTFRLFFYKKK
jgi:hypothetical protein